MEKFYKDILTENISNVARIPKVITEQTVNRFKTFNVGSDRQSSTMLNKAVKTYSFIQGLNDEGKEPWLDTRTFRRMVDEVEDVLKAKKHYGQHLFVVLSKEIYTYILNGFDVPDSQITKTAIALKEKYGDVHEFWLSTLLVDEENNKSAFLVMGRHLLTGDPKQNCFYVGELKTKTGVFGKIKSLDIIDGKIYLYHSWNQELDLVINSFARGLGY